MTDIPPKPEVAPPVWDNIPQELARRPQWVLWKFEWPDNRPGNTKWQKVPYYVGGGRRTGDQGSERDRQRLQVMDVARRTFERGAWDGIGFAFLPDDGLVGIDVDGAVDLETGEVSERCLSIVTSCASFTEYSPSGKGCHVIGFGKTTTGKDNGIGVEMFCSSQFFTVTGRLWEGAPSEIRTIPPLAIDGLHAMIQRAKDEARAAKAAAARPAPAPSSAAAPAGQAGDDFTRVNAEAMRAFSSWVPQLLPAARVHGDGYRVTSQDLGRDLQEDLAFHRNGIYDFGLERGFTPIDVVMEHLPADKPKDALAWLAERLGIPVGASRARTPKPPRATLSAPAGGKAGTGGGGGAPPDDEPPAQDEPTEPDLVRHRGKPIDCRENVLYCLRDDPELRGIVRLNNFTELHERSRTTPWHRDAGEWDEEDDLMLGEYLLQRWGLLIKATSALRQGVLMAAREHRYNPIIDLIKSEEWDGTPRLESWLADVYEVEDRPYTRLIGRCFIMGMVMRAMRPGCKFDYMLILKGEQGLAKSGSFRVLAEPWFTDNAIRVGDKDSIMTMQLVWIAESAELESLNKAETTAVKQFLSAQDDMYRPPYGAQIKKRPRHTVMGGTTNADTFLKDATGDRRFWPLEVQIVNLDVLRNMRLQLFAEAYHRLRKGEQFWPTREEERELVFPEQEKFKKEERWEDYLNAYVNDPGDPDSPLPPRKTRDFFPTTELYDRALQIKADRIDGAGQMDNRIANAMKALGFVKHRETSGLRRRGWIRVKAESEPDASASRSDRTAATTAGEDDGLPF